MARADKIFKPVHAPSAFPRKTNHREKKGSRKDCYHSVTEMWLAPVYNIDSISVSTPGCQQKDSRVRLLRIFIRCSNTRHLVLLRII